MLGVEIGEKFIVTRNYGIRTEFYFNTEGLVFVQGNLVSIGETLYAILCGNKGYKILKEPYEIKPQLTEDERVILKNLHEKYKWIARDCDGKLYMFKIEPLKYWSKWVVYDGNATHIDIFNHLFQFVKWEDQEPYSIEELLKGE